ncbi:MAG: TIM barrel protein [Verrucomicrobiota bacterium]
MNSSPQSSRRNFLKTSALAAAGSALAGTPALAAKDVPADREFCTFIKPLQEFSYDELADIIADLGFQGIEATVRGKGHVLPENVQRDLPKLVKALEKRDLRIFTMASDLNDVTKEQHTETVLKTAADLGIPSFRMAYYKYDLSGKTPLQDQLESFKAPLGRLIDLVDEVDMQALYQNHSGANYCGANLWDLFYLMKDYPKNRFASGYDIGHALVEGGKAWPQNLALMLPRIEMLYVKGPAYTENGFHFGPLADSSHDHKRIFAMLAKGGFTGPYNLHVEYHMKSDDKAALSIADMESDLATLKSWLNQAGN